MTLNESIKVARERVKNPYARSYLYGIGGAIEMDGTEALSVQLQYVLANCQHWRGEEAREVKEIWRNWIKSVRDKGNDK